jgi:hypothetical protein
MFFPDLNIVVDNFFDGHSKPTRSTKTVPTQRLMCPLLKCLNFPHFFVPFSRTGGRFTFLFRRFKVDITVPYRISSPRNADLGPTRSARQPL